MQNPHLYAGFFALLCHVLHRIAFPVVSEWCQNSPCIRATLSSTSSSFQSKSGKPYLMRLTGEPPLPRSITDVDVVENSRGLRQGCHN